MSIPTITHSIPIVSRLPQLKKELDPAMAEPVGKKPRLDHYTTPTSQATTRRVVTLINLPNEILTLILSFLPSLLADNPFRLRRSLCSISLVHSSLSNAAQAALFSQETLVGRYEIAKFAKLVSRNERIARAVRSLKLSVPEFGATRESSLYSAAGRFLSLSPAEGDVELGQLGAWCTRLRHLDVKGPDFVVDRGVLRGLANQLTSLALTDVVLLPLALPSLRSLSLSNVQSPKRTPAMILPALKSLSITYSITYRSSNLVHLRTFYPTGSHLESLAIGNLSTFLWQLFVRDQFHTSYNVDAVSSFASRPYEDSDEGEQSEHGEVHQSLDHFFAELEPTLEPFTALRHLSLLADPSSTSPSWWDTSVSRRSSSSTSSPSSSSRVSSQIPDTGRPDPQHTRARPDPSFFPLLMTLSSSTSLDTFHVQTDMGHRDRVQEVIGMADELEWFVSQGKLRTKQVVLDKVFEPFMEEGALLSLVGEADRKNVTVTVGGRR